MRWNVDSCKLVTSLQLSSSCGGIMLITISGHSAGILIGVSIPVLIRPLLPGHLTVPVSGISVVVAFLVSCLTGVLFGYLPANRAAKLQPTESLRYE